MASVSAASLVDLQVGADRVIGRWTEGDCGCNAEQVLRRVVVGCLSFRLCECCGG